MKTGRKIPQETVGEMARPRKGILARLLLMFRRSSKGDERRNRPRHRRHGANGNRYRVIVRGDDGRNAIAVTIHAGMFDDLQRAANADGTSVTCAAKRALQQYISAKLHAAGD